MVELIRVNKGNLLVQYWMQNHYSQPKGFVGRQLIYLIKSAGNTYGAIAAGSTPRFLPGRNDFFISQINYLNVVNNTFFHVEKIDGKYPFRNFVPTVIEKWRQTVMTDWLNHYGDYVLGWETLVELPRTGEIYIRDGWTNIGQTKGFTCKRTAGKSSDSYTGKRVWNTIDLRPKLVFARKLM